MDHARPSVGHHIEQGEFRSSFIEESPNPEAQNFFDMLATT